MKFLDDYFARESVGGLVVGEPKQMDGTPSESEVLIQEFLQLFAKKFPAMPVHRQDERFTSKMATQSLRLGGASKKKRQNKALVDQISAVLILQAYIDRL
jgi:putative Holliday junction resolvase